ncbi:MAG: SWIM zinc finger family protein [Rikenellaceae bacterium]
MKIDLTQFEQQIDETILKRGLQYFKQGKVLEVSNEGDGVVVAEVEGSSENYTTYLQIKDDMVVDSRCSCPYDFGPVCKHVVALIFHLKQEELGVEVSKQKDQKIQKTTKRPKDNDPISIIAETLSRDELLEFVKSVCKENESLRSQFMATYNPIDVITSKSEYNRSLSSEINSLKRSGFIDYRAAKDLGGAFMDMCATAECRMECGDYISAINAAIATIEQANRASGFTDDSNGCIGDAIYSSMEILKNISEADLDDEARKYLLKYVHKLIERENKSGIGCDIELIEIAINLVGSSSEKRKVRELIEQRIADKSEWRKIESKELMAKFITSTDGDAERMNHIINNLDVDSFRDEFVCVLIRSREYNKAIELLQEALNEKFSKNTSRWQTLLLEIYTAQNNTAKIIETARYFILNGSDFSIKTYYNLLRTNVADEEWAEYINQLYCDVRKSYGDWGELAIVDQNWAQYLDYLRERCCYYGFEDAHKVLPQEYYPQFVEIYCAKILDAVPQKTGRDHHRDIVRAIRRVNKLGDRAAVDSLVSEMRVKFKNRRTLIEELDKI